MATTDHTITAPPARRLSIPAGDGLLRLTLTLDAAVTGANGVAYLALAGPLDDLLGIPGGFLRATGVFLVACAGILLAIAVSAEPRRGAIFAAIPVNVAWALASVAMLVAGWHDPTTAGALWIGLQAGTVALFAALQTAGARR
jgi:hypothetical protein